MKQAKTKKLQTTMIKGEYTKLQQICDRLGLSEAEYIRGAIEAKMRLDTKKVKNLNVQSDEKQTN